MKLVVTEKPSVAKSIAEVIGACVKNDGYYIGNDYIVSWCIGHLVTLSEPNEYDAKYSKWNYNDLPIIPSAFKYKILPSTKKQFKILKELMARSDVYEIIEATDAGREGELIFRLVYNMAECHKPFLRLWISSMEDKAIKMGFKNLVQSSEFDNLYNSALCRQQADWIIGINGTRLFTCLYGNGIKLPVGRVQTPTLRLICDRDTEINNFKPKKYYKIKIITEKGIEAFIEIKSKDEADIIAKLTENSTAEVSNIINQEKKVSAPYLYDLTSLQKDANRLVKFTAQQTLDYLQELYEKKLVTYPRTDSKYITSDMVDTVSNIIDIVNNKYNINYNTTENKKRICRITNDAKVTDHHAIIPTEELDRYDFINLTSGQKKLLDIICYRLISATSMPYVYESTKLEVMIDNFTFQANGITIKEYGWYYIKDKLYNVFSIQSKNSEKELPFVELSDKLRVLSTDIIECWTKPPLRYTDATLLAEMEKAGSSEFINDVERTGLGTPATRASIIEKLIKDGLIIRKRGNIIATENGINLIHIIPDAVKSPNMTVEWENQLYDISKGKMYPELFMKKIIDTVEKWVTESSQTITIEDKQLFCKSTEQFCICPVCGHSMYESGKAYYCENSDFTFWKDNKYFNSIGLKLNNTIARKLIETGKYHSSSLYSKKKNRKFSATIIMNIVEGKPKFALEFS